MAADQEQLRQLGSPEKIKNELVKQFTKHIEEPDLHDPSVVKVKMVVLGPTKAGKTCWVSRLITDKFNQAEEPTIGAKFSSQGVAIDETEYHFEIWDVSGEEWCRSLCPMYLQHAHAAVICYDPSDRQSFDEAKEWVQYTKRQGDKDMIISMVGTKADLENIARLPVQPEEAEQFFVEQEKMESLFFFPDVSSKTGENVQDVILTIAETFAERGVNVRRGSKLNPENEFKTLVDKGKDNKEILRTKDTMNRDPNDKREKYKRTMNNVRNKVNVCFENTKVGAKKTYLKTKSQTTKVASSFNRNSMKLGTGLQLRTRKLIRHVQSKSPEAVTKEVPVPKSSRTAQENVKSMDGTKIDTLSKHQG